MINFKPQIINCLNTEQIYHSITIKKIFMLGMLKYNYFNKHGQNFIKRHPPKMRTIFFKENKFEV